MIELYIPLWEFDYSQQGVDPYGIKQMIQLGELVTFI